MSQRDLDPIPDPAESRPQTHRRRTPAPSGFRDDAHAVVIGIDRYQDLRIPDLQYAAADARAFHDVLTDPSLGRFRPENVTLLLDSDATERRIRSAIGTELPRRAAAEHTVCIFFAGHGAPVMNARTASRDGLEKYLLPHDAIADDLRSSGIAMDDVNRFFDWIDTSQLIFFIDSCYSGVAGGRTFGLSDFSMRASVTDEFLERLSGKGRLVVTACATNEVALEKTELGHGLFTYYLIEGLKGKADTGEDGLVTLDELYDYVYRNVEREARVLGGSMSPLRKGSVAGTVYLTQYETPAMRRLREAAAAADAAFANNDFDEADRLWTEVLELDPESESARNGRATLAELRAREQAEREREEMVRQEALRARQRVLLEHRASAALSIPLFAQAMELLEKEITGLRTTDRMRREFTDALIDGKMSVEHYVQSIELLDAEPLDTGTHRLPVAPASPASTKKTKRTPARRPTVKNADSGTPKANTPRKSRKRTVKSSTGARDRTDAPSAPKKAAAGTRGKRRSAAAKSATTPRRTEPAGVAAFPGPPRLANQLTEFRAQSAPTAARSPGGSVGITVLFIVLVFLGAGLVADGMGLPGLATGILVVFELVFPFHLVRVARRGHRAALVIGILGMAFYAWFIWMRI